MRREQVVEAVVYGQHVPEESIHPPATAAGSSPAPTPAEPVVATGPTPDGDAASAAVDTDGAAVSTSGAAVSAGGIAADDRTVALAADDALALSADDALALGADGADALSADRAVALNAEGVAVDADGNPIDDSGKFLVRLDNFTGPFDLLLQLIGKHKLDVTEVALHTVTDDFIAYIRAMGDDWDLDEASEFLVVAATLLDLKAARLLPSAEVEDEEDLALLEARDLLFARLLQYKAYKEAAAHIMDLEVNGMRRWPRAVSMEPRYAEALPDLVLGVGPERLFKLALKQFAPKPGPPQVSIAHIHQVRVSVREHATLLHDRLRRAGSATFTLLVADCENTLEVVARFLALLELYREGLIDFEQPVSLDELIVRWIGGENTDVELDIDDYEGSKPDPDAPSDADPTDADPAVADPAVAAPDPDEDDPSEIDAEFEDDTSFEDAARAFEEEARALETEVLAASRDAATFEDDTALDRAGRPFPDGTSAVGYDATVDGPFRAFADDASVVGLGAAADGDAPASPDDISAVDHEDRALEGEASVLGEVRSLSEPAARRGDGSEIGRDEADRGSGASGSAGGESAGSGDLRVDGRLDVGGAGDDLGKEDDDAEERS